MWHEIVTMSLTMQFARNPSYASVGHRKLGRRLVLDSRTQARLHELRMPPKLSYRLKHT